MNGRETLRQGNRDDSAAPQGVYRCQGEDEWVSISVGSQEEWRGFVEAMDSPQWAEGDKFGDAFRRWKHHDELDGLIKFPFCGISFQGLAVFVWLKDIQRRTC